VKSILDQTLKAKRAIQARQAQEELAFDLKILEELLKQAKLEESEQEQRKVCTIEIFSLTLEPYTRPMYALLEALLSLLLNTYDKTLFKVAIIGLQTEKVPNDHFAR